MGSRTADEIDAWLRDGGIVVTASDRAARAIAVAFHRARQDEGLTAWTVPDIRDWTSFVRTAWEERALDHADGRLLLNPAQERSLWAAIAATGQHMAALLEAPRYRLANLAMEAHELLAAYAPQFLKSTRRNDWQQDAAAFSNWLTAFDETCRVGNLLSPTRLPLELIALLENPSHGTGQSQRPPLLLAGFDRILPIQRTLFDAWGEWRQADTGEPATQLLFHEAPDIQAELDACARWCGRQLAAQPRTHLLVVTQDATARRGQIERALSKHISSRYTGPGGSPLFEFSLGIPLSLVTLPKAAHLLLRWLTGPLAEHELDWLLSTGHAASPQESSALQSAMRKLRRHSQEQPQWTLRAFIGALPGVFRQEQPASSPLPTPWVNRVTETQSRLADLARRPQRPLDWAELVPQLLDFMHFASFCPLSSAEFQALHRWRQAVEICGSLGFDGRRIQWQDFLSELARIQDETLFAPESRGAPIQIAGPAESAGLSADAVWFLGANEDAWPANGVNHPLLPPEVQRQSGMPHATPQLDWDLTHAMTTRLLASAPVVHFSYARQQEGAETRPSRLIAQLVGLPQPLAPELTASDSPSPLTVPFEDASRVALQPGKVAGGASVLTAQSQCPFKAFATARLAAQSWEPAEAGLTPSQRGKLLHAVLHAVWAGPPDGIRTQSQLHGLTARGAFVAAHVRRALAREIRPSLRERMPRRYLELEESRLIGLVTEWLDYEAARIAFEVTETEAARTINVTGLSFNLRLDRIDRLNDNSLLVIDYKTGDVSPKSWDLPRPDDVQLPLYAAFALDREEEELGGLVFAKVRPGDQAFAGKVFNCKATLMANLPANSSLLKYSLSLEQLLDWRTYIEQLALDFLAGHAEVDPRDYPRTCERCGLQTLCRVQENPARSESEPDSEREEAGYE
jgi:probable DNA repair protein